MSCYLPVLKINYLGESELGVWDLEVDYTGIKLGLQGMLLTSLTETRGRKRLLDRNSFLNRLGLAVIEKKNVLASEK